MPDYYENVPARGKPYRFLPPRPRPGLIRLAKRFSGRFLWDMLRVSAVEVEAESLELIRGLRGQRAVLTPNHPSWEPLVLFDLSRQLDMEFNYLCAKEVFLEPPALIRPWFLQSMGAYSVARGTMDREALKMTRELLVRGERFLVLFPEGEVCWQNDVLLPFQQGAAQMAFWALDDLAKQQGADKLPPLYFIPLAVKYFYGKDMSAEIEASLARLERQLGISRTDAQQARPQLDARYARLMAIGECVVAGNEKRYGLKPAADSGIEARIAALREKILGRIADSLGVRQNPAEPLRDRIRALFNAIDNVITAGSEEGGYAGRLSQAQQDEAERLTHELWRVMHFIAVQGDYVGRLPSPERYLDTLGRLELEVFRRQRLWGPRVARVKAGSLLDLRDYYAQYCSDKRGALAALTAELEQRVKAALDSLGSSSRRLHELPQAGPAAAPEEPSSGSL
ncbi:1-acyl-sn-glycerol-3-phosphate acyltransferase [bacterium]|nr:1-acyl-sn-glycerol-3-phosphate acyltransferase [bacterium]